MVKESAGRTRRTQTLAFKAQVAAKRVRQLEQAFAARKN